MSSCVCKISFKSVQVCGGCCKMFRGLTFFGTQCTSVLLCSWLCLCLYVLMGFRVSSVILHGCRAVLRSHYVLLYMFANAPQIFSWENSHQRSDEVRPGEQQRRQQIQRRTSRGNRSQGMINLQLLQVSYSRCK